MSNILEDSKVIIDGARLESEIIANLLMGDHIVVKYTSNGEIEGNFSESIVTDPIERDSLKEQLKEVLADLKDLRKRIAG